MGGSRWLRWVAVRQVREGARKAWLGDVQHVFEPYVPQCCDEQQLGNEGSVAAQAP